jgi:hypothetical protein
MYKSVNKSIHQSIPRLQSHNTWQYLVVENRAIITRSSFWTCKLLVIRCYSGDQVKKHRMGGTALRSVWVFATEVSWQFLLSPIHSTCPTHLTFHGLSTLIIFGKEQIFLATRFSRASYWFLSIGSKYSPRHPVLKQHEPVFISQSNIPYSTPILTRKQAWLLLCGSKIYILILRF